MPKQPRHPKGSPSAGQWRTGSRNSALETNSEDSRSTLEHLLGQKLGDVVHVERFDPPAPGGYDSLLVGQDGITVYVKDHQPHRSDGVALVLPGQNTGSYYLGGQEVDQYDVFRLMAPDPDQFDRGYDQGVTQAFDAAESAIGDYLRLGAIIANTMQLRPDDDYMRKAPDLAAIGCGSADAAGALRIELSHRYRDFPATDPCVNAREAIRSVRAEAERA